MTMYAVEVINNKSSQSFNELTENRINHDLMSQMFFPEGFSYYIKKGDKAWIVQNLEFVIPKQWSLTITIVLWSFYLMLKGFSFTWWMIIPSVPATLFLLDQGYFYRYMMRQGLRKEGYKDEVTKIPLPILLKEAVQSWVKKK